MAKVLIIHTGGTFGMAVDANQASTISPHELLSTLTNHVPELCSIADMRLKMLCNLDSSDIGPTHWVELANLIRQEWDTFDGCVIIHGTDTLAFTAAALSFMFSHITKPIVFTGSQRPLKELRNDARANIIDAVQLASTGIPEIMVCFDSRVHRGTRVTKFSSEHMEAFKATNTQSLGNFGVHFKIDKRRTRKPISPLLRAAPLLDARLDSRVLCLDVAPGIELHPDIRAALLTRTNGLVIRGFGVGNLPINGTKSWVQLAQEAADAHIPFVMSSLCIKGSVDLSAYENGRALRNLGAISVRDMSYECAVVKLMVCLGRGIGYKNTAQFMVTPLASEVLTEPLEQYTT